MQTALKLALSLVIILVCTQIGKRIPSLGGLLATMPLTGVIVMVWLYMDRPGDFGLLTRYTQGALWGILPSILFFLTAFMGFKRGFPLHLVLPASFGVWLLGALVHQWLLRS
jgi:uncharacterized membrane protein (GlpM family)